MSEMTAELMRRQADRPNRFDLGGEPLKPCPFCGSYEIPVVYGEDYEAWWCYCLICGCEGPFSGARRGAIKHWQTRDGEGQQQ
jgi:hypothetical protein